MLQGLPDSCVSAVVTDPPYELGFMGKRWDSTGVAYDVDLWREALRVLKSGGHLLAFGGSRTFHRLAGAVEDAGFEIRDQIMWIYGSGFPKSLNVSKAIDRQSDDLEPVAKVARWLIGRMSAAGVSRADVNVFFGYSTKGSGACQRWTTPRTDLTIKPRVPSVEQWERLRALVGFDGEMDSEVARLNDSKSVPGAAWFERESTGVAGDFGGFAGKRLGHAENARRDLPATDAARQWDGWGTSLKPAHEPIVVARKPFAGTVASNVLEHGTGALNVDGCRVASADGTATARNASMVKDTSAPFGKGLAMGGLGSDLGRWPANVVHDGSEEAVAGFPESKDGVTGRRTERSRIGPTGLGAQDSWGGYGGKGSAGRYFYCSKPSKAERQALNHHETVKPVTLMRWLVRLVTPTGGLVLDPFLGSGTTGIACEIEGFPWIGIEQDPSTAAMAQARIARDDGAVAEAKMNGSAPPTQLRPIEGPLFEGMG